MLGPQEAIDLAWVAFLALISIASYRYRATDKGGTLAAFITGSVVGLTAGWLWVIYLIIFFAVATLATKFKYNYKSRLHAAEEKGGARGAINVLANGGLSTLFAFLYWASGQSFFAVLFVASIASSLSDTLATEIGLLSRKRPRELLNPLQEVEPGKSGGITSIGILAEVAGSVIFALLAFSMGIILFKYVPVIAISGVIGSNIDSLLGATLQGYYVCSICNQRTERGIHCSERAKKVKGLTWMGNNAVNFLSSGLAAFAALALQMAL